MRHERGDLAFTDIFVRTLSERRTNLWLLPPNRSPRLSSLVHGRWMGVPRSYLFYNFFCALFIIGLFIYVNLRGLLLINK